MNSSPRRSPSSDGVITAPLAISLLVLLSASVFLTYWLFLASGTSPMQVIDSRKITDSMARTASNDMATNLDKAQEKRLIAEINHYRHEQGLPKLKVNRKLEAAAAKHSKNMATMNFFSHTDNQGLTPFDRIEKAGYPVKSSYTGENLAAGQMYSTDVLDQWLASKLHRAVLNNPNYTAIGIKRACNVDTTYGCYWTANFGSKRKG